MTNILIGALVLAIIMIQIFYFEPLRRYKYVMFVLFALIISACVYYFVLKPAGMMRAQHHATQQPIEYKEGDKDYDKIYIEAFLAFQHQDYDTAAAYFHRLYTLRPKDTSYYQAYANTLLLVDPRSPTIPVLVDAIKADPKRDVGVWLLLAHDAEVRADLKAAKAYYAKALELTPPDSPLYKAIGEKLL